MHVFEVKLTKQVIHKLQITFPNLFCVQVTGIQLYRSNCSGCQRPHDIPYITFLLIPFSISGNNTRSQPII